MAVPQGEGSRLQEQSLTLSSVQAAHEQAQSCTQVLECLWLHSWASLHSALGLTGCCDLGSYGPSSLENLTTDEWSRNTVLVSIFMPYTSLVCCYFEQQSGARSGVTLTHRCHQRWKGSSRSLWGQYVPHISKGLNPSAKIYFSFCKSSQKSDYY